MTDCKLFALANGRKFRVQATSRTSGKTVILKNDMTQKECEAYQPNRADKLYFKYFKVAFNCSPKP